ncbi:MAG: hypothetical protein BWK80_45140 [Desulfobacteraceae bacterium IS3]|nr:MAG: hypothetical protein BWK80_45140 [Desulfobacteraceae bacterium IS3]
MQKIGFIFGIRVVFGFFILFTNSYEAYGADTYSGRNNAAINTAQNTSYLTSAEMQVIAEINKARTNPPQFAEQYLAEWAGKSSNARECYEKMKRMTPREALIPSFALSQAAKDFANESGRSGLVGSTGSDSSGLWTRIDKYGIWSGVVAESISYGYDDPLTIIAQLLVDSKTSCGGQQENILNTGNRFVGVGMAAHKTYRYMCVIAFASDIKDK